MKDVEIVVFQDKSWVRLTEYQKVKEEKEQLQKNNKHIQDLIEAERQRQEECNNVHLRDIATLEKENEQLKQRIGKARITLEIFENTEDNIEEVFCLEKLKELLGDTK